ncbi:MAG: hypothetical protein WBP58_03000 [Chitinophagaceae bacterium]
MPNYTGVFFVYLATYDNEKDIIKPVSLVFIGQATKVRDQIKYHIATDNPWHRFEKDGHEFCFSAAYLSGLDMERIVSAFVFQFKPPANIQGADFFTYDPTTITARGKTALLKSHFTVEKHPYE